MISENHINIFKNIAFLKTTLRVGHFTKKSRKNIRDNIRTARLISYVQSELGAIL